MIAVKTGKQPPKKIAKGMGKTFTKARKGLTGTQRAREPKKKT